MSKVRFLAVARVGDRVIVATHAPSNAGAGERARMEDKARMVLRSDRVADQKRLTINDREVGAIHYECDAATLYMAVTEAEYPQRTAFAMLAEFQDAFESSHGAEFGRAKEGGLSKAASGIMAAIARRYEEPGRVDKVAAVSMQVDAVKGMMQNNINTVLKNKDNIQDLLEDTSSMAGEASTFSRTANQAKNALWWKNAKLVIAIVVLCIVLCVVVFGSVYFNKGAKI